VRAEAVTAIGRLGDEDAVMLLFELLGDERELIQERAMAALAQLEPERVSPLLLQGLVSADENVIVRAAETLALRARLGGGRGAADAGARRPRGGAARRAARARRAAAPRDPGLLRGALQDPSSLVRQQALLSLGKLEEPEAAAELLPFLDDPDPKLRFVAVRALGQIRNPEVVERLIPFLKDKTKELRFAAVEAMGTIRAAAAARPLTQVLQDPDRNLRRAAAEALGAIADPQAVAPLLLALADEHWSVRSAAAAALGRIKSGKATSPLLERLSDEDASVRRAACAALGEIGDARAARPLLKLLEDASLQATAVEALRQMGASALPDIERGFASAPPQARRLLIDAMQRLEDRRARRLLLQALLDDSAPVRAEAALALGDGGYLEAVRPLMDLKAQDPAPEVRRAAAQALKKLAPH
jgi:HEAT repeat protein